MGDAGKESGNSDNNGGERGDEWRGGAEQQQKPVDVCGRR